MVPKLASTRARLKKMLVALLCVVVIMIVAGAAVLSRRRPTHDRAWVGEQALLPSVTLTGSHAHVRHVRDFTYRTGTDFTPAYRDRTYDLQKLQRVWFGLSPFNRDWRGPAHAFLSFQFSDGQYVAVSVEARREAGEKYSIWKGALRQYELIYVIGEERDLVGVRVVKDDPVYLYPMRATPEQARALFVRMLRRAQQVERRPEFYNTFSNNCTTNILEPVNQIADKDIPFGLEILLPGYSDKLAHERGLIDTELPLEQARRRFEVNERARAA
ncbi:MAG TPA: DUF4105 domain-containing protein, partial [Longimicrobium sp.]|nr:DUF4105 domain-containing protein [Longimicrobium sp.]